MYNMHVGGIGLDRPFGVFNYLFREKQQLVKTLIEKPCDYFSQGILRFDNGLMMPAHDRFVKEMQGSKEYN